MKDILLDENFDLQHLEGDFVTGESLTQDVAIILLLSQGELKSDPLLGANLIRLQKSTGDDLKVKQTVKNALARDGKNYDELMKMINIKVGKG